MPTAASSAAPQTTVTANAGAGTSRAASATATGLEGLFAQMIAAMEAAAAKAAATAGLVTPTTAPTTAQTADTVKSDTETTDETTANSDLAGALAVMVQSGTLSMSPAGLASPASLGSRGAVASATSAQKAGIDGGPTATAAPGPIGGATAATAGIAATDATATPTTPTATTDTGAATSSASTASATPSDGTGAKDTAAADPLGLQALVAKSTTTTPEKTAAGPRLYDRPTPRAADTAAQAGDDGSLAKTDGTASTHSRLGLDPTMNDPARPTVDATPKGVEAVAARASGLAADETADARKDDLPTTGDPQPTLVGAPARHDGTERIADRAATTTVSHAVALSAVAETVASHVHAGTSRFAIRLDPAELGTIDVRVEVKSTGEVRAHLVVERADTLDMMLRDQKSLERSLAQSGLDVGSSGLQFSLKDQGSGNGSTSRDDLPRAAAIETDEPTPVALDLAAQAYRPRRPGGLDLRI